jgi:hypothetical protein
MGQPKKILPLIRSLAETKTSDEDKKMIEVLREKISRSIVEDPQKTKKAALILSSWLNPKK